MSCQQNLKSILLVTREKTEKGLRIFANVMMDIQKRGLCRFELGQSARCHRHQIPNSTDFEQRGSFAMAFKNCSS